MREVVVTGLGFVTSIGNSKSQVSKNLRELNHGFCLYPPPQIPESPIKVSAPVREFQTDSYDPEDWTFPSDCKIRLNTLRSLAPHGLYAYYAFHQAINDAQLDTPLISNPRTGLYTASSGSSYLTHFNVEKGHSNGYTTVSPMSIVASIVGTLTFNLSSYFKIQGSSTGLASACASSGHALGLAFDEIRYGRQDRMFVVGGEDCSIENFLAFSSMRALSLSTDPNKASRPFDSAREGFVPTGGSTVMVLEERSIAEKRNAPIYAKFSGWGQATDGYHIVKPHPEGRGLISAMNNALQDANLAPKQIDYINAHATSTPSGDLAEMLAIKSVFNPSECQPTISSTKALTGHGLSLASIMEAAFCVLGLKEGFTPGSANIENLDPEAHDLNVITQTLSTPPTHLLSNSSGFGGANTALIFSQP